MLKEIAKLIRAENPAAPAPDTQLQGVIERIGVWAHLDTGSNYLVLLQGHSEAIHVDSSRMAQREHLTLAQPGDAVQMTLTPEGRVRRFVNVTLQARVS